ncbi:MAG: hypothetical protein A3I29_01120 [Candidatus Magasanikbacteria bacterium RIFCSPLOWO2_02_FULL_44_11]|uniref:Uncharacterized protein n=1 Tax=Candidatus Magasanikbacteria bacterium RIFCSPLOWO2_02_FULL_44_11 TaxID=1798689 RepID=A0A1F6N9T2_9BACT|nr:MAG: hypothetical protein A3I29_01120 [Candidatus Magasanikbacteria bacterium RIFCSPLOWO2_02_FULL_44_11]
MINGSAVHYRELLQGFENESRRLIVDSFRLHLKFFSNKKLSFLENQSEELVGKVLKLFIDAMERSFELRASYTLCFKRVSMFLDDENWQAKLVVPHFVCAFRGELLGMKEFEWVDSNDAKMLIVVASKTLLDLMRDVMRDVE